MATTMAASFPTAATRAAATTPSSTVAMTTPMTTSTPMLLDPLSEAKRARDVKRSEMEDLFEQFTKFQKQMNQLEHELMGLGDSIEQMEFQQPQTQLTQKQLLPPSGVGVQVKPEEKENADFEEAGPSSAPEEFLADPTGFLTMARPQLRNGIADVDAKDAVIDIYRWRNTYAAPAYSDMPDCKSFSDLLYWSTELYDLTANWWKLSVWNGSNREPLLRSNGTMRPLSWSTLMISGMSPIPLMRGDGSNLLIMPFGLWLLSPFFSRRHCIGFWKFWIENYDDDNDGATINQWFFSLFIYLSIFKS
jgi:hypothetical protein